MAVRDDRGDVKQTTTGFRGPLMVQSLTSAKSKFLSLLITQERAKMLCLLSGKHLNLLTFWTKRATVMLVKEVN